MFIAKLTLFIVGERRWTHFGHRRLAASLLRDCDNSFADGISMPSETICGSAGIPVGRSISTKKEWSVSFVLCIHSRCMYRDAVKYANCATKTTLLLTWQIATDGYARAVSALSRRIGAMSPDEYERLHLAVEKARRSSKEARNDFQAHIDQHHCTIEERAAPLT